MTVRNLLLPLRTRLYIPIATRRDRVQWPVACGALLGAQQQLELSNGPHAHFGILKPLPGSQIHIEREG